MPEAATHAHGWRATLTRGLVVTLGSALLLSLLGFTPANAAVDLASQIGAARRSQIYHESVMRAQDHQLQRLSRAHKGARKALRQGKRHFQDVKSRRAAARKRVQERTRHLAHIRSKWPEDAKDAEEQEGKEPSKVYLQRLGQAERQLAGARKSLRRADRRTDKVYRAKVARQRRLARISRHIRAVVSRQNAAEGALASQIVSMTRLAQQRASLQTAVRLGPGGDSFAWPAFGSITQRYGCTGFYLNPRRGSCSHFHDGLDMSPDGGTAVRSVAPGVVAYVGWNPWDSEGRAFIVVIGHPGGFHSRYGHLQPIRQVRVGQMVGKGETIGRMGSTGMSTGVHLHVELLDRSGTVDPLRYLPLREVDQRTQPPSSRARRDGRSDRAGKARGARRSVDRKASAGRKGAATSKRSSNRKRSRQHPSPDTKAERRAERRAVELEAAGEGATPPWVVAWSAGCQAAGDSPGATRDRRDVAGQVDDAALASTPILGADCEAASFEATLALARAAAGDEEGGVGPPRSDEPGENVTAR